MSGAPISRATTAYTASAQADSSVSRRAPTACLHSIRSNTSSPGIFSQPALQGSGRDFTVGVVSLVSGLFSESNPADALFMDKLAASASIPVVFPYVDLKQVQDALVDGGVRNIRPFASAFHTQPDEIYVLLTSKLIRNCAELPDSGVLPQEYKQWDDNWLRTKVSGLDVLKRTVDILSDEVYVWLSIGTQLFSRSRRWNAGRRERSLPAQAIEGLRASLKGKRYVPIDVLAPHECSVRTTALPISHPV